MLEKLILSEYSEELCQPFLGLMSNFSLTPYGLIFLRNELFLNKRKNILEFGSGLSTLFMAQIIKKHNLKARIWTVENGEEWISLLKQKADKLNLADLITIIHAPLVKDDTGGHWYDVNTLKRELEKELFDMVFIDGPPAYNREIERSRYTAVPFVLNLLSDSCVIFLDDADRTGEQEIIKLWNKEFNLDFKIINRRFAVYWKGRRQNSIPSIMNSLLLKHNSRAEIIER